MSFPVPRPRGKDAPSKAPRKTNHSRAPKSGNVHLLLDSNGRQTVSLERRTSGITIESREQWAASLARNQRIRGGEAMSWQAYEAAKASWIKRPPQLRQSSTKRP